jgi:hypothetical protein
MILAALDPTERAELLSLEREVRYKLYEVLAGPKERRYFELCNKGLAPVQHRLAIGEFIATGVDPHDHSGTRRPMGAGRWPYAAVNFETWAVQIYAVIFVQVEVSTVGGLHISEKSARLGAHDLDLQGRPLGVLLTLARAAKLEPGLIVSSALLNEKHISANADKRELPRVVFRIRRALIDKAKMSDTEAKALVQNILSQGYRLNKPPDEIFCDDEAHR